MRPFQEWQAAKRPERRFRASLYIDIFVPQTDDLEADRANAEKRLESLRQHIRLNSYIGGVAYYTPQNLLKPLDREI